MSERVMTRKEIEADLADLLTLAFPCQREVTPEVTLAELGFDEWDVLEVLLTLEDRFGEATLRGFMPTVDTKVREIVDKIDVG